jgi:type III restriction enzyme
MRPASIEAGSSGITRMSRVVIQNPILNSPFRQPTRHFHFDEEGITDTVIEGRRESEYFMPVPASRKKKGSQLALETEWTQDRIEKNVLVNQIRTRVGRWRQGGWQGVTPITRRLLEH